MPTHSVGAADLLYDQLQRNLGAGASFARVRELTMYEVSCEPVFDALQSDRRVRVLMQRTAIHSCSAP